MVPFGTEAGLGQCDFVLNRDPAPSPKRGHSPPISAHVYCGQTARWIKIPLGTEIGLGPNDIVLDGAQLPQKGHGPQFSSLSIVAKRSPISTTAELLSRKGIPAVKCWDE